MQFFSKLGFLLSHADVFLWSIWSTDKHVIKFLREKPFQSLHMMYKYLST